MRKVEGKLNGERLHVGLVVSRFNDFITTRLSEGAIDALRRHGVDDDNIEIAIVPGCLEIPLVAKKLAESGKNDAIIALGAVIRGSTPHFQYVAAESAKGLASITLDSGVPVINGILTTDSIEQAVERAGSKSGNKGASAAIAGIETANLLRELEGA